MLNPSLITDSVVNTLRTIPDLVAAMGGDATRIYAHKYLYGQQYKLVEAIETITPPGILVSWEGTRGGNFSGMQIWKHVVCCYIRIANTAGSDSPIGYEDVFHLMMNGPVNGQTDPFLNIRNTSVLPGQLDLMDTPSALHMTDMEGEDFFRVEIVMNEIGDQF